MGWAIAMMTGKLLRIYAFNAYTIGREPSISQFTTYLSGGDNSAPLDFYAFPRLFGNFTDIQQKIIGSPMYGPSGMLLAVAMIGCPEAESRTMVAQMDASALLMDSEGSAAAMQAAFAGETPENIRSRLISSASSKRQSLQCVCQ